MVDDIVQVVANMTFEELEVASTAEDALLVAFVKGGLPSAFHRGHALLVFILPIQYSCIAFKQRGRAVLSLWWHELVRHACHATIASSTR